MLLSCTSSGCFNYLYKKLLNKIHKLVRTKYLIAHYKHRMLLKHYIKNTLTQLNNNDDLINITPNLTIITKLITNIFNINNNKKINKEFFRKFCVGK
ncbi:hypothetical protein ACWNX2_00560 [Candidatus Vidania fulgoroideorum]